MNHHKLVAALTATLTTAVAVPAIAAAGRTATTTVTVRIEGKNGTLLAATKLHTHLGWVTVSGTPKGKCSQTSAAGALDVATHHRWGGTWSKTYSDIFIKRILGEIDNGPKIYWGIWTDNISSQTGACEIKLHAGEALLVAAAPYPAYPIGVVAPATATVGHPFTLRVVAYNAKGKPSGLAGATVFADGHRSKTGAGGTVKLTPSHNGAFTVTASKKGYVRDEATLRVS